MSIQPADLSGALAPGAGRARAGPTTLLGPRRQLVLAAYWLSLSFQGGALPAIALPSQVLDLSGSAHVTALALLGGLSGLVTMLVQPVAGALSDLSSSRWGRRRPYLLGGAALDAAGLLLMARAADLSTLLAGFLLAGFGSGVSGAAYQAYIPDQVPPRQYG